MQDRGMSDPRIKLIEAENAGGQFDGGFVSMIVAMIVARVAQSPWFHVKSRASSWGARMGTKRTVRYAFSGAALALGAPLGWFAIRFCDIGFVPEALLREVLEHLPLYTYLLIATAIAFTAYGARVGFLADRLVQSNGRLQELVSTDALTSLKNARYFRERLHTECARSGREGSPLALVVADLDHFKRINDQWGHSAGDDALIHAAEVIGRSIRTGDIACRIGGEEFGIICPGAGLEEGAAIAERIRSNLEISPLSSVLVPPEAKVFITSSLGVAVYKSKLSPEMFFRAADQALYTAKRTGRNQVHQDVPLQVAPVSAPKDLAMPAA
jgi:diguanylate cyclase (GGDEF)-like protein